MYPNFSNATNFNRNKLIMKKFKDCKYMSAKNSKLLKWNSDLYSILPFKKEVERDGLVI